MTERFRELQALPFAVDVAWPAVLTVDDTTFQEEAIRLIQTLGTLNGKRLDFFHGASLADFDEFVGGYIQQDVAWLMRKVSAISETILQVCLHLSVYFTGSEFNKKSSISLLEEAETCQKKLTYFVREEASHGNVFGPSLNQFLAEADFFARLARRVAGSNSIAAYYLLSLDGFLSKLHEARLLSGDISASSFVWVKSDFIKAIKNENGLFF